MLLYERSEYLVCDDELNSSITADVNGEKFMCNFLPHHRVRVVNGISINFYIVGMSNCCLG